MSSSEKHKISVGICTQIQQASGQGRGKSLSKQKRNLWKIIIQFKSKGKRIVTKKDTRLSREN
jgi:hypothetical protein